MLRTAALLVAGAAALAVAAPNGKVVRVERDRRAAVPRLCDIQPAGNEGLCVGAVDAGDRVSLIDVERGIAVGEFRIDSMDGLAAPFACPGSAPTVFKIKGALSEGDPDVIAGSGRLIGLRNLSVDPRVARVLSDETAPGTQERPELALDLDGNDTVDYMLVRYSCDEAGNRVPSSDRRFCFDTYLQRAGKLVKAHTDNIELCY